MDEEETTIFESRTHPKVLFKAAVILLLVTSFQIFLWIVWPESLGWDGLSFWGPIVVHGFLLMVSLWYAAVPALHWWNSRFTLTSKRVRMEWGVLYKHSREIDLRRIASISEERGVLDRMFGCGTLNFYDAAAQAQPTTGGPWNKSISPGGVRFVDVPRAKNVKAMVESAKSARE